MSIANIWQKSALIDVEASGLMKGSFPVEAGWWVHDVFGHLLINPSNHWDVSRWDIDAEKMHGLTPQILSSKGQHPIKVASRLNVVFKDKIVFSDSPDLDLKWLEDLHSVTKVEMKYEVQSIGKLLGYIGIKAERAYEIFEDVHKDIPSRGRALVGVRYLKAVVEKALQEVN